MRILFKKRGKEISDELLQEFESYKTKIISEKTYESKWRSIKARYAHICLYKCEFVSIGETVPRLFNMIEDLEKDTLPDTYQVVLPSFRKNYHGDLCNQRLVEIFGQKINIINDSDIDFWLYVIKKHRQEINLRNIDKYRVRRPGLIGVEFGKSKIDFSADQIIEAKKRMHSMGIERDFVCMMVRETKHKSLGFDEKRAREYSTYECALDTFKKASAYLIEQNMQVVRMGKYESEKCNLPNVIDYANDYYDELMDFYLASKCKFMLGSASGYDTISGFWGRPVLSTNNFVLVYGYESMPDTGHDMIILQKLWSWGQNRYLNLREMLDVTNECDLYLSNYEKRGISLIRNTDVEIYNATVEMNLRLDGVWEESEEERAAIKKYYAILEEWRQKHAFVWPRRRGRAYGYQMITHRICWSYLKENMYLLDN